MTEIKGYIFLCSDITESECIKLSLFGGTEKYAPRVKGLEKGVKLFLYNQQSKKLQGIFEAISTVGMNINPTAWKGDFPLQVRVKRISEHAPISRDDIKSILKFDMVGRPTSRLDGGQIEALEKLFKNKKRIRTYRDEAQYLADDGHRVRSKPEQKICDWLYKNRIVHGYEVPIPGIKFCDFEVPLKNKTVYIEYWGLKDEKYLANKEKKIRLYKKHKLPLINLELKDIKNLNKILGRKFNS
jgi:hypothetical protein